MRMIPMIALAAIAIPAAGNAATPLQMETATWQTFKDKNVSAFSALFAPDYVGVYDDGAGGKAKEIDHLKNANVASFKIGKFTSKPIDADDMLMTYDVDLKATMGKADISGKYHAASVWHRTGNKWLGVYHTEIKAR